MFKLQCTEVCVSEPQQYQRFNKKKKKNRKNNSVAVAGTIGGKHLVT